ncbi:hypothetical protein GCM10023310_24390 [Paenibacillus vulneris]
MRFIPNFILTVFSIFIFQQRELKVPARFQVNLNPLSLTRVIPKRYTCSGYIENRNMIISIQWKNGYYNRMASLKSGEHY